VDETDDVRAAADAIAATATTPPPSERVDEATAGGEAATPRRIVVMGVSGSGKSTIGALVATALGIPFVDGDSLHPLTNVEKMAAGVPLDDDDRWPWLRTVGRALADSGDAGLVLACSALKRSYRDAIRTEAPDVLFLHLHGERDVLARRLEARSGHFMPPSLLDSQFAILEPLADDERAVVVDVDAEVTAIVDAAVDGVRRS
jgi:carbohydrate kinase (thermoresistant glucokinase family)